MEDYAGVYLVIGFLLLIPIGMTILSTGVLDMKSVPDDRVVATQPEGGISPSDYWYKRDVRRVRELILQCCDCEGRTIRSHELQVALDSMDKEVLEAPIALTANPKAIKSALRTIEEAASREQARIGAEVEVALKVHLDMAGCELESSEKTVVRAD